MSRGGRMFGHQLYSCLHKQDEEDHARPGWTTSRRGQDSPWKSQSEWQRTGINGENASMVWSTLGSKSAKEQEQEHKPSYCLLDARTPYIHDPGLERRPCCCCCCIAGQCIISVADIPFYLLQLDISIDYYRAAGRGQSDIVMSVSVCLCVCSSMGLFACNSLKFYQVLWLLFMTVARGPPLAALRYVMYFRFYGWHIMGHMSIVAASDVTASSCAGKRPCSVALNVLC